MPVYIYTAPFRQLSALALALALALAFTSMQVYIYTAPFRRWNVCAINFEHQYNQRWNFEHWYIGTLEHQKICAINLVLDALHILAHFCKCVHLHLSPSKNLVPIEVLVFCLSDYNSSFCIPSECIHCTLHIAHARMCTLHIAFHIQCHPIVKRADAARFPLNL